MIDVSKKLDKIEKNCCEAAKKDFKSLKEENDNIILEEVLKKVNSYKEELTKKYTNEISKMEREYNRNLFDYEMKERVKINKFKKTLKDNLSSKVEAEVCSFVDSFEYKHYLFKIINKTFEKLEKNENIEIYITEKDFDRFYNELQKVFSMKIDKIGNENIGGCIIIDSKNKVSINNTLKTNIEEKIEKINL